jgi:hypothetical protein
MGLIDFIKEAGARIFGQASGMSGGDDKGRLTSARA